MAMPDAHNDNMPVEGSLRPPRNIFVDVVSVNAGSEYRDWCPFLEIDNHYRI